MTRKSFLALCSTLFLPWRKKEEPYNWDITWDGYQGNPQPQWFRDMPKQHAFITVGVPFRYIDQGESKFVQEGETIILPPGSYLNIQPGCIPELIHS